MNYLKPHLATFILNLTLLIIFLVGGLLFINYLDTQVIPNEDEIVLRVFNYRDIYAAIVYVLIGVTSITTISAAWPLVKYFLFTKSELYEGKIVDCYVDKAGLIYKRIVAKIEYTNSNGETKVITSEPIITLISSLTDHDLYLKCIEHKVYFLVGNEHESAYIREIAE